MNEYQVKLEILREYEDALRFKKLYTDLVELNSGLLKHILLYYEEEGLEVPNLSKVKRMMMRLVEIVDSTSPNDSEQGSPS